MAAKEEEENSKDHHEMLPTIEAQGHTSSPSNHHCNGEVNETSPNAMTRRFSYGDHLHLPGAEHEDVLIGRAMCKRATSSGVLVTEIVPSNWTIQGRNNDSSSRWKMPIELFSSKKQQSNIGMKSKRIRAYYKAQDKLINAYEDIEKGATIEFVPEDTETYYKQGLLFSKVTLVVNLGLLIAKLAASILSGSIAVISSVVDSCLDLVSGIIMWWASKAVKSRSLYSYPQGRTKLEPVAIIILSVVMALSSMQIIRESVEKIVKLADNSVGLPEVDVVTFCIMGATIVIKLVLYLICRTTHSLIVQALAMDHRNDVISNSVAIVFGYLGSANFFSHTGMYEFSYLDPVGAILISLYIIYNWWRTGSEQIKMLTGHTARPNFLSQLTWVVLNHHPEIQHVDTVRAFHFGNNFLVEVDIVLCSDMFLKKAHDIGESLQHRLESLPDVERAFVHLDYEFTHHPHSEHKVV